MSRPFTSNHASASAPTPGAGSPTENRHLHEREELRRLFDGLIIGLTLWDVGDPLDLDSLRLSYANPAAEAMFGYSSEGMLGTQLSQIILPGRREDHQDGLAPLRQDRERWIVGKTLDLLGCRADGETFPIQLSLSEWQTEDRFYFAAVIRDMSLEVALEAARSAATESLKESNRDLESFAYVASHDLREPLRKIIAFGERLKIEAGDTLTERGEIYLDRMASSATRMQQMIDDLLELSRVATRGARFERLDLAEVVSTVLGSLEEEIDQAGGRIEVAALPTIEADRTQMQLLFQNLLTNALKFRPTDRALEIHVRAESPVPDSAGTESVRITVEDNGIGFDLKHRERAFQPFERLHARSAFEGSGIGLSICRRIVERHGGTIGVDSVPDEGSCFWIRLPLRHDNQEEGA